eukprot:GILI01001403.1.p2 GENE.GILI01001403.1~~GILI01001403.1.p2  ORF type:complete len:177 (+),score=50.61 GILI01001403.1:66-596(+)
MPHVCSIIAACWFAAATVCAVLGTAGSQYMGEFTDPDTGIEAKAHVFLYKTRTEINGDSSDNNYDRDDFACKDLYDKLTTSFAFGIIACVAGAVAVLLAIIRMCSKGLHRVIPAIFGLIACGCLLVAFAISVSTFTQSQCDVDSYDDRGFDVDWGLAFLIAGCGVAIIGSVLQLCC